MRLLEHAFSSSFIVSIYLHPLFTAELKSALSNFIERETTLDYDREADQALQRLVTGDVDVNQLTDAWARSYVEVMCTGMVL